MTDYLKAKPDSVVYYGDKKSTASWQLLYFIALKLIAAKHPDELMRLEGKSILGDKIEIGSEIEIREFSHPLGIMRKPDGKWLFAETDFNVQQILLRLKKLMEICKDPLDTMVIYFSANQSQNVSLRTDKSDSPLIRKSLAEIFRPKVPKATPTVTTAEQQYVQWLIQKGEKPSEAQAAFSMTEKVINRLQISAKRLFSVTSAVELKYILSALRRTPQWHYFSSRQQNQIVHTIDLYREFRESSAKALANAQAASTVQPPATTSTSHPSVLPAPALSGSQKISSPEKFSCAGANPLEVLFDGKHIEAKTWKDVYVAGVKELYSRYPQKFISLIGDPDNKTGVYIETAYRAHKLKGLKVLTKNSAGQWLYLETEKTPDEAMTSLYKLLDHCGVAHTALSVQCKKAESDVPVTVTDVSIPQVVSSAPAKPIAKPVAAPVEKTAVRTPPNANSSAFYQWMRNEMHLAESSSRSYASAINNCEQLARQIGLDSTALYDVSLDVATRTKDLLIATKEYTATNARQNNRLRAALAKYIQYLSVPESTSTKKEPIASKPVATPMQAPAVISPVSQELIRDVEKVVLDADLDGIALSDLYGKIHASDYAIREAVSASSKIVSLAGKLYHEDAFVDWDDGASQMEQLLEKLMIGEWLRMDAQQALSCSEVQSAYPELYAYLQHTELFKDSDSERYFDSYKSYKLSNRLPQDEDIYFSNFDINSYPYRYTLLSDSITTDSVILWIDALGAEWLSLLCWTLQKDNNGQIKSVALAQSCLPTETEYNDQWNKMDTPHDKLDKLDKLAHHGVIDDPSYYACIQEQFSFFSKVVDKVEELFQKYHRVIITGDHGSSRLAARFFHAREGYPAPASSQVCSHGRFCIFNGAKIIASSNQVIAKDSDGNQYLIFKNYDHFKQSGFAAGGDDENAQYGELHGGASPEELLVPVVVFDSIHELPLTATWKKDSIKFSMKKAKPVILFNKPVQNVQASLGSVDGICTPIDTVGKEWMIVFSENKAEATKNFKYDPIIIADGKVVHVPSLEIKPALGGGDFDL